MANSKNTDAQQENTNPAVPEPETSEPDAVQEQEPANEEREPAEEKNEPAEEESEPAEEKKTLTALAYILYNSRQYKPGDELPANNEEMVQAWLEAGTAAWLTASEPPVKAKPATAEPGIAGDAVSSESEDGVDLVGKVPKTAGRKNH